MTSSGCHTVKVLNSTVGYFLVAMVPDLLYHFSYNSTGEWHIQCMPCSSQIINEILPESHTMEKTYFFNPIIYSQIIYFSDFTVCPLI